jgi:hypothetical protein
MPGSTGARPDKDVVLRKRAAAVTGRRNGLTYQEIADIRGDDGKPLYANRQNARAAVLAALQDRMDEAVDQYRAVQGDRYERMIRSLWATANQGGGRGLDAMAELRRVMADLNRLYGLNVPTKIEITDEMDREISALAAKLGDDGTWDITGIPDGDPPMEPEEQEQEA